MNKKITITSFLIALLFITSQANAQWALGGSYQVRDNEPKKGFGIRVERDLNLNLPLIKLGFRGHFNFFNEENNLTVQGEDKSFNIGQEMKSYDFGLTALTRIPLGIVEPYIGLGVGSTTTDINFGDEVKNLNNPDQNLGGDKDSELSYYGVLGGEVPLLGSLRPFIEYRFTSYNGDYSISGVQDNIDASNGRAVFGVIIRF